MERKFNVIRIPVKYTEIIDMLTDEQQLYIYKSLSKIGRGADIKLTKTIEGGLLSNIFEEWMNMESKNGAKTEKSLAKYLSGLLAQVSPGNPGAIVYDSIVKDSIVYDSIDIAEETKITLIAPKVATLESHIKKNFDSDFIKDIYEKYPIKKEEFHEECNFFLAYWKEKSPTGKKERWEKEKVFDPKLRFRTWMRNNEKWGTTKIVNYSEDERQKKLEEIERKKKLLFA